MNKEELKEIVRSKFIGGGGYKYFDAYYSYPYLVHIYKDIDVVDKWVFQGTDEDSWYVRMEHTNNKEAIEKDFINHLNKLKLKDSLEMELPINRGGESNRNKKI